MLQIYCPYCEEIREEEEFHYVGEAHIVRPTSPNTISDENWGQYLFHRKNTKGLHDEMWFHSAGCRKFFNVTRDTLTYEINKTTKMNDRSASSFKGDIQYGCAK
ncbi:sarcosine oxidase subunit delta [Vibrio sp. nBUS_14]|uniref:sarcosine oxidase subunit delta n=1 Tax=Vibrio sp. nBUS_14 TaxID=3395321 RepID=UPI003EB70353